MLQVLKLSKENKNTCAAFIVKDNKIISKDICHYSEYKKGQFIPTRHAEINAIERACKKLKSEHLDGCYLYSSLECCPMCTTAAIWARVKGIIYCILEEDRLQKERLDPDWNWIYIKPKDIVKKAKIKPKVMSGYLREEGQKQINSSKK